MAFEMGLILGIQLNPITIVYDSCSDNPCARLHYWYDLDTKVMY